MRVPQNVLKLIMNSKNPGYHFSVQHLVHIKMLGPSCCPSPRVFVSIQRNCQYENLKKNFFFEMWGNIFGQERCGEIYLGRGAFLYSLNI